MKIKEFVDGMVAEAGKVIVGQDDVLEQIALSYLAGGHVILEGVPGLAKTLMARTIAKVIGKDFKRIQFTPDLMPADIIGNSIFNLKTQEFEFKKGAVFTNILLADEINRAGPKTQSALLEVMQEKQITADGIKYHLDPPFMVLATQNPVEFEGTYPLPEAQLDRFLMKIVIDYPSVTNEIDILKKVRDGFDSENIDKMELAVLTPTLLDECREEMLKINVDDKIVQYIADIVRETRKNSQIHLGASTRAAAGLLKLARFAAALDERDFVIPDDVKRFIKPVLRHRIVINSDAEIEGATADTIIEKILGKIKIPG